MFIKHVIHSLWLILEHFSCQLGFKTSKNFHSLLSSEKDFVKRHCSAGTHFPVHNLAIAKARRIDVGD